MGKISMIKHGFNTLCLFLVFLVKVSVQDGIPNRNCVAGDGAEGDDSFCGYDAQFYQDALKSEDSTSAFARQLGALMPTDESTWSAASVVDVGCGAGLLVSNFRSLGFTSHCLEGSPEASDHWPKEHSSFYHIVDLTSNAAREIMPVTDYVTSFEVAEHIAPEHADNFVSLLTMHTPKRILFGAATEFQDRGQNPTHVNEREFAYWIAKFKSAGYAIDLAKTAELRHKIITDQTFQENFNRLWWYPKNVLVFASLAHTTKAELNEAREKLPAQVNMLDPVYVQIGYNSDPEFGKMWERDWTEFGNLFHAKSGNQYEVYA